MEFVVFLLDTNLSKFLTSIPGFSCYFSITWLLTWFSHEHFHATLFDFFIARGPVMPMYTAAALVMKHKKQIMALERDFPVVHLYISKIIVDDELDLISRTLELYKRKPFKDSMCAEWFGADSCITRFQQDVVDLELADISKLCQAQEQFTGRKPRRSIGAIPYLFLLLAIVVGVVAALYRKQK